MNLKMKLRAHVTAIARRVDKNTILFSDEVSPTTDDCLRLLVDEKDVLDVAKKLAIELNKDSRFNTRLLYIDENNECTTFHRRREQQVQTF